MIEIHHNVECAENVLSHFQSSLEGVVSECGGEQTLTLNNALAKGYIRCITFDWGVSLLEINALFLEDVLFIQHNNHTSPIHFSYCSQGPYKNRLDTESEFRIIEQYHSSILVSKKQHQVITYFAKDVHIILNDIQVIRKKFLKRKHCLLTELNETLYTIFVDKRQEMEYTNYSTIHLKMEDLVTHLRQLKITGLPRMLQIEGDIYHLLSMHIERHNRQEQHIKIPHSLLKDELKTIKCFANKIEKEPSVSYNLEQISRDSGLSQAKLQEGFKFLFARTVTEYIRHIRLEAARDLMNTTDLNISQIVYTIGFTSRSYFSKIFKEKYDITPNEFRKQVIVTNKDDDEFAKI